MSLANPSMYKNVLISWSFIMWISCVDTQYCLPEKKMCEDERFLLSILSYLVRNSKPMEALNAYIILPKDLQILVFYYTT